MHRTILLLILFLLAAPYQHAMAEQAVNCHCFRNRTFNPEDRFAADDYLLTTVFNSLTAGYFAVGKRRIVMLKMKGGARNDELLIALYIARHSQAEVDDLLAMRKNTTWDSILEGIRFNEVSGKKEVHSLLIQGAPDARAAARITAEMLSELYDVPQETLDMSIQKGFTWRQLALALTLAEYTGSDLQSILSLQRKQSLSWSEIAHNFGLEPAQTGKIAEKLSTGSK